MKGLLVRLFRHRTALFVALIVFDAVFVLAANIWYLFYSDTDAFVRWQASMGWLAQLVVVINALVAVVDRSLGGGNASGSAGGSGPTAPGGLRAVLAKGLIPILVASLGLLIYAAPKAHDHARHEATQLAEARAARAADRVQRWLDKAARTLARLIDERAPADLVLQSTVLENLSQAITVLQEELGYQGAESQLPAAAQRYHELAQLADALRMVNTSLLIYLQEVTAGSSGIPNEVCRFTGAPDPCEPGQAVPCDPALTSVHPMRCQCARVYRHIERARCIHYLARNQHRVLQRPEMP